MSDEITLSRTIEPPSVNAPIDTSDLGKEREIRTLRKQVVELTEKLSHYDVRLLASVTSQERYDRGGPKHGYSCGFHTRVFVSMTTRSVTCQECGEELEPMDVLREFARQERRFVESITDLRQERAKLTEEVSLLRKQRASLRSQVNQIRKRASQSP